jgi:hypothetical protein
VLWTDTVKYSVYLCNPYAYIMIGLFGLLIFRERARLGPMARSPFFVRGSPDTTAEKLISLCTQMYNFSYWHVFAILISIRPAHVKMIRKGR